MGSLQLAGRVFDFCIGSSEALTPVYLSASVSPEYLRIRVH